MMKSLIPSIVAALYERRTRHANMPITAVIDRRYSGSVLVP
jgi:hypothetical protein